MTMRQRGQRWKEKPFYFIIFRPSRGQVQGSQLSHMKKGHSVIFVTRILLKMPRRFLTRAKESYDFASSATPVSLCLSLSPSFSSSPPTDSLFFRWIPLVAIVPHVYMLGGCMTYQGPHVCDLTFFSLPSTAAWEANEREKKAESMNALTEGRRRGNVFLLLLPRWEIIYLKVSSASCPSSSPLNAGKSIVQLKERMPLQPSR